MYFYGLKHYNYSYIVYNLNRAKYLKNIPIRAVKCGRNVRVVDKFRKHASFFYAQEGHVRAWVLKSHAFVGLFRHCN